MKKQLILMSALAIVGFTACNDTSSTTDATKTDSTATVSTTDNTAAQRGTEIANFSSRTFMDLKTNQPVKLRWNAEKYYYEDESGNQPYYYYDPASKDTFDYWGRRLNSYLTYNNGDYTVDESRLTTITDDTMTTESGDTKMKVTDDKTKIKDGDTKIKSKDDKYKEKTDDTKMKVTDDKMKVKDR